MKWINIKEQLPETEEEVLVSHNNKVYMGYFSARESWNVDQQGNKTNYLKQRFFTISLYAKTDPDDCCSEYHISNLVMSLPYEEIKWWIPLPLSPKE